MTSSQRLKPVLGILLASVLTLSACSGDGNDDSDKKPSASESTSQSENGPSLDGIPDVVAEVNGEEVTKDEFVATYELQFQQATMQAQTTGQQPDEDAIKKQSADELVNTKLLLQEAKTRNISATDKDVEKRLAELAKQNQMGSVDEFLKAVEKQGTTEDFARSQTKVQVIVERLVKDETGPIKPTDGELRKLYDQAVTQAKAAQKQSGQKQQIPPFAKAKSQLKQQAKSEEQSKAVQGLIKKLRKGAKIKVNL